MMHWLFLIFLPMALFFKAEIEGFPHLKARNHKKVDYSNQTLVSVTVKDARDLDHLQKIVRENEVDLWSEAIVTGQQILMRVPKNQLKRITTKMRQKNLNFKVAHNLERLIHQEEEQFAKKTLDKYHKDSKEFFNDYHSLQVITSFLKSITKENADISRFETIGHSEEKRPINAVTISVKTRKYRTESRSPSKNKKMILIDCGIHAREWASISFCLYFINQLITGYKKGDEGMVKVLQKYDFTIIPVLNPDGYNYARESERLWRKNRSKIDHSSCRGIDVNRNFDVAFKPSDVSKACAEDYCGKSPFSTFEAQSLDRLLKKNKGRIQAYFTIHTYGQLWLLPWAKTKGSRPKHYKELLRVGKIGAEAIKKAHGLTFLVKMAAEILYVAGGISTDYVYEKGFAKYSYALELRDKGEHGFLLPKDQIPQVNEETSAGILAAIAAMM